MDNIRIIFVVPNKYLDKEECSEAMHAAFEVCKQNVDIDVSWIKESNVTNLKVHKTDFIVFEEFEGKVFENLKTTRSARIVGPWALTSCLVEGKPIPNFDWPIYNVAMYKCLVTCSYLPKDVKANLKAKIELMGGCYVDTLLGKNTHLITGSARSEKYLAAADAGVKLMCTSWVEDVWTVSQTFNVHADDEQFKKHRCPVFYNLVISSTGIINPAKLKLEKLITENGGKFTGKLNLAETHILICNEDAQNSEKYKAARQNSHIKCVTIDWATESVNEGYALPHNMYQIQKMTSTPTKVDRPINPEFSVLSAIGGPNTSYRTFVEDSMAPVEVDKVQKGKRKAKDYEELVENLDIKKAKKAGQYLDGYSVYLAGFIPDHTEKLNKVINLSGATRYDTFSDRVTHIIVGDRNNHEILNIKNKNSSALLVSMQWLIDSIEQRHPVNEEKYLVIPENENSQLGSPLSKKGLSLLLANKTVTEEDLKMNYFNNEYERTDDCDLILQNLRTRNESDTLGQLLDGAGTSNFSEQVQQIEEPPSATPQFQPCKTSTQESTISVTQDAESEIDTIFEKLKFFITGFNEEEFENLKESITEMGGDVVSKTYKGIPDYAVVPIVIRNELHHTATEIVNDLFITDCKRETELLPSLEYYHKPVELSDKKPLDTCVVTISSYTGIERVFLKTLIEALGGIAQEQFSRIRQEAKDLLPSTHLVSREASGKKYEAALKWKLPVINKDWLLECSKTGKRVYEGDFLLGDSQAPNRDDLVENTPQKSKNGIQAAAMTLTDSPGPSGAAKVLTPVNQITPYHKRFLNSAEKFSQVTPVNKIMKQFRESNKSSSQTPKETKEYTVPPPWAFVKTPNTPLGACMTPNPSPGLRKQWEYWLQQFPDCPSPKSNKSTPLSEIKRKLWKKVAKMNGEQLNFEEPVTTDECQEKEQTKDNENLEISTNASERTPENQQLANRLEQLENMLSASSCGKRQSRNFRSTIPAVAGSSEFKDSQPCTIGWDFRSQEQPRVTHRIFSLSGVPDADRARMVHQLEELGGTVSNLANYDPTCTHLLTPNPARNEKSLSCMSAGKWILHTLYLDESVEAGNFLSEEDYEFGNPKSMGKIPISTDKETELRMQRMHWWRKEISRRGYGAFNDMRAIVVAAKRDPIIRVIEAGGGVVIDFKPPFEDTIHATHCLIEQKSVKRIEDYAPLAKQGIFLVNTVYISDFLHNPDKDIRDNILPYFLKYYTRNHSI